PVPVTPLSVHHASASVLSTPVTAHHVIPVTPAPSTPAASSASSAASAGSSAVSAISESPAILASGSAPASALAAAAAAAAITAATPANGGIPFSTSLAVQGGLNWFQKSMWRQLSRLKLDHETVEAFALEFTAAVNWIEAPLLDPTKSKREQEESFVVR